MKKVFMIAVLSMSVCLGIGQSKNDTGDLTLNKKQQHVWNHVVELHDAVFGNKDSAVMERLVSSDLHYGHSGGNLEDKRAMVHNASSSATRYENVTNHLVSINMLDDVAVLRLVLKASSIDKGVASPLNLGIIQVWSKEKGYWRLIERQAVKRSVP